MKLVDLSSMLYSVVTHSRFPVVVAIVAVLLSLPALWQGLKLDDYYQRAAILGLSTGEVSLRGDPAHLYAFMDGNPDHTLALIDTGNLPWWTDPEVKGKFFRPVSALSHLIDYSLWPDHPLMMHAHSLVWLFAVVLAAGVLYRRLFGALGTAGLALLLFAFDDAHATLVGWIAQRNTLVTMLFGILALLAHHRWRAESWRPGRIVAPGLFATALLAGEAGIATFAYLAAHVAHCPEQSSCQQHLGSADADCHSDPEPGSLYRR